MKGKTLVEGQDVTQFWETLESLLVEPETAATLKAVSAAQSDITVETIRVDVEQSWTEIRKLLEPAIEGREQAQSNLDEARASVEKAMPALRVRRAGRVALFLALLVVFGTTYLMARFDSFYGLLFLALAYVPLYWIELFSRRRRALSEFAVEIRETALARAEERFLSSLIDQVTVAIRESVNRHVTSFEPDFRIFDTRGLRELADPEREISTSASNELSGLLTSLDSGSIGLAGPRGAGKTTLIDSFALGRSMPFDKERIGLVVSAPVKYDARDFVLHLFGSLCKSVIGEDRLDEWAALDQRSIERGGRAAVARLALFIGCVLAVVGIAMLVLQKTGPEGPTESGIFLLVVGFFLAYGGFLAWNANDPRFARQVTKYVAWLFRFKQADERPARKRSPEQHALEHLKQIRFQQSLSSGRNASLKLPLGFSIGADSETTVSRTPWSLPEAIDEFRRFASNLYEDRYLVIGIDEMDKIETDKAAREFLNNVKGVFGVKGCYYLVSVSEDAMSTFERRGLPVRDVFDSSFDAVQRVGYLTLGDSRMVLESRVTGLPVPFQCLCHCLAGGLPRELIRVTRSLVREHHDSVKRAQEEPTQGLKSLRSLGGLSKALVCDEHQRKVGAAIEAGRGIDSGGGEWLMEWLWTQASQPVGHQSLRSWTESLSSWPGMRPAGDDRVAKEACGIAAEMAAFGYYAATVLELFGSSFLVRLLQQRDSDELDPIGAYAVEQLAVARQHFTNGPWLAWDTISRVRHMVSLAPWDDPHS